MTSYRKWTALGLVTVLACANTSVTHGSPKTFDEPEPPTVIVMLVVDQLRADLLDRYESLFDGGLARLLRTGRRFSEATHDHGITETSPGHATISTGTYPSRHGMVSNIWYTRDGAGPWQPTENVIDPTVALVGAEVYAGSSPKALMRTGLGDWLLDDDDDAKVVSVSGKDRAAILLAGMSQEIVYWFEPELGRFATSTYYRDSDPEWVEEFNEGLAGRQEDDWVWDSTVPIAHQALTRPDTAEYEADGVNTYFPHAYVEPTEPTENAFQYWWSATPFLDREVLALARRAVDEMELGDDDTTDLLAISLSATDRVGHEFGPFSREQLDNLLRLDRELGDFLAHLDEVFGDRYVLAFTADHGVSAAPDYLSGLGQPARRLTREDAVSVNEAAGEVLREPGARTEEATAAALAAVVAESEWIAAAWGHGELSQAAERDTMAALVARSVYHGRATGLLGRLGVEVILTPNTLLWVWTKGTTHGSPYLYDRRVPLIFAGHGVSPGLVPGSASTASIAPTLALLAGIAAPPDVDGVALPLR